jgi:hypothetical protein
MTNSALLKQKIAEKGLKIGFIVEQLGTSYGWFNKKLNNEKDFNAREMQILCDILGITDLAEKDRIFFAKNVEKSST